MKKIKLIIILLFAVCIVYAQTGGKPPICFSKSYVYTSDIETDPCAGAQVSINVKQLTHKISCTITVDDKKIPGFFVKNSDPSNKAYPDLYSFYKNSSPKKVYLFIKFYKEKDSYKADMINENWVQAFKPCFDHKLITLVVE